MNRFGARSNIDFTRLKNLLTLPLKSIAIDPTADFCRDDENNDGEFYRVPRFVHHIDDRARDVLSQFYTHAIKQSKNTLTLDLCSSWTSHLPEHFIGKNTTRGCRSSLIDRIGLVHGLGMNESELKENRSLNHGYTVQDLNHNPSLTQFSADSFDAAICSVSVDYLVQPVRVFDEIGRLLKPDGQLITAFSNRCFPTKVIRKWLTMNELQRVQWVANYFLLSNRFFDPASIRAYSLFDGTVLPVTEGSFVDPMYVVLGRKRAH